MNMNENTTKAVGETENTTSFMNQNLEHKKLAK